MSVKVMGWVWDADLPKEEKFILLAYADHADHDGRNVYPAVSLIVHKTNYSERSVRKFKKSLIERGILVEYGISEYGTPKYYIDKDAMPMKPPRKLDDSLPGRPEKTPAPHAPPNRKPLHAVQKTPARGAENPCTTRTQTVIKPSNEPSFLETQLFDELAKLLNLSNGLIKIKMAQEMDVLLAALDTVESGLQPGSITAFGEWWYDNDWRGKKGQKPTLDQIRLHWNDAKQSENGKVVIVE